MANKPELLYWDACVFSSYAGGIAGRAEILASLVAQCPKHLRIVTSTLSIAEASFASGLGAPKRSPAGEAIIDGLWESSHIELVSTPPAVMYRARDYMRHMLHYNGRSVSGADAVHLATCEWLSTIEKVFAFHTYDDGLLRLDNISGIPIVLPSVLQPMLVPESDRGQV